MTAGLTVTAFGLFAYVVARDSAVEAAHARLRSALSQIKAITELGGINQIELLRTVAGKPAVVDALHTANGGANGGISAPLEEALRPLRGSTPAAQAAAVVEIVGDDGVVRRVVPAGATPPPIPAPLNVTPEGVVGPLFLRDGALYFQSAVSLGPGRGVVRVTRRVGTSSANHRIAANLLGSDAALLVGNQDGLLWSGTQPVQYPGRPETPTRYIRDGKAWLSISAAVKQSPWLYAVELPESVAVAPARALIIPFFGIGLAIVLVSVAVGLRLDAAHDRLETEVDTRTRELSAAVGRLRSVDQQLRESERFAELGRLSGSIGHELRNPLGVMTTVVTMIDRMPDASPRLKEYARLLGEQLRLSERIINDVLDRARSGAPVHSMVDVTELLDDIVLRAQVPPHITVERKDVAPLPPVSLDRDHVGQIVWNLITNAAQAIQGHLQRPGTITVGATVRDERLRIEVRDTGPGLRASEAERIFEPMYTTKADGVGLGLSISRAFARASGGDLFATKSAGPGACFVLDLPATSRPIPS